METVDEVDWSQLGHAYGAAEDVPGQLRALASEDEEARKSAIWELFGNIWHQGTVYDATAHAVPFLIELVASDEVQGRDGILELLRCISAGRSYLDVHQTMDCYHSERESPEFKAIITQELGWVEAAHAAVVEGTDVYLRCLHDPEDEVRKTAARVLRTCGERSDSVEPALRSLAREDSVDAVRATAVISLRSLWYRIPEGTEPTTEDRQRFLAELMHETEQPPLVRLAAATVLVETGGASFIDDAMPIFEMCMQADLARFGGVADGELDDPYSAINAVLAVDTPTQLEWILRHLRHGSTKIRESALWAAECYCQRWRSGPTELVGPVAELLSDPVAELRRSAARTLKTMGSAIASVEAELVAAAKDRSEHVREAVDEALRRARGDNPKMDLDQWLRSPEHNLDTPELVALLADESSADRWERWAVLHELSLRNDADSAVPVLRPLLNTDDQWQRVLAARALWAISRDPGEVLPTLLEELRCRPCGFLAADCLCEIGPPAATAVPQLREIVETDRRAPQSGFADEFVDSDDAFRWFCEQALQRIDNPSS